MYIDQHSDCEALPPAVSRCRCWNSIQFSQ